MKKSKILKKRKWLKNRRREKKIRKQQNYVSKTHMGTRKEQEEKELKIRKRILG